MPVQLLFLPGNLPEPISLLRDATDTSDGAMSAADKRRLAAIGPGPSDPGTAEQVLHGGPTPFYSPVSLVADVLGVLPVGNGGTGSGSALGNRELMVSSGGEIVELGPMTDGQLVVGSTGNLPAIATPTGANGIVLTPGPGSLSISQSFGSDASHAAAGNDSRFAPTPSTAGKIPYDNGTGYSETATAGSSTQVLHGGATPAYGAVSLTQDVSGVLPAANGGSGSATTSANFVFAGPTTGAAAAPSFRALVAADLPTGIPAPSVGSGTVSNTAFGYLANATSDLQAQLNTKQSSLTLPLSISNGGTNSGTVLSGKQLMASTATAIVELGPMTDGQLVVGSTGNLPAFATPTGANGIVLTPGPGSLSISQSFGSDASHAAAGNDSRFAPTPSTAGKIPYDNGTGYSETATAGSSTQVLHGGATPAYGAVSLTQDVSGVLLPANGGSGSATTSANLVFAGPTTGAAAAPGFRAVVAADLPSIPASSLTGTVAAVNGGFGQSVAAGQTYGDGCYVDSSGALQIGNVPVFYQATWYLSASSTEFAIFAGPSNAGALASLLLPTFTAERAGSVFNLRVKFAGTNAVAGGDTVTITVKKSSDGGTTWTALTGSSVTVSVIAGGTGGTDLTHTGTFAAGDMVQLVGKSTTGATTAVIGVSVLVRYN